jgi:hypothetical protein
VSVLERLGAIVVLACAVAVAAAYLIRTRASRRGRQQRMIAWAAAATVIFGGMALVARAVEDLLHLLMRP